MGPDLIRRGNLIKLGAIATVAGSAVLAGINLGKVEYPGSKVKVSGKPAWYGNPREIVPIMEQPLRFNPEILQDRDHLLPPEYDLESPMKVYPGGRFMSVDSPDPWRAMRLRKLKLSQETASFTRHTIPGYLPDIAVDSELMSLTEVEDSTQRFEDMVSMMGIETRELSDPENACNDPEVDPHISYCARRLVEYAGVESRALHFDMLLMNYLQKEQALSGDKVDKIYKKRESLHALYKLVSENFTRPMSQEYLLRVTRPAYLPSKEVWDYSSWEGLHDVAINNFPIIQSDVRTRTIATVLHAHSIINGKQDQSPLTSNSTGLALLKPVDHSLKPHENSIMSAHKLLEFVESSQQLGYEEVVSLSFQEMMDYCAKGYYILNFHYDSDPKYPNEDVEILWQNREARGRTLWALSSSGPAYSYVYKSVNPESNPRIIGLPEYADDGTPKVRQFVHKM